ncbi:MAG: aspartate--tRNA ligase [Phycisphaerales bacterium]|nr:MAG: aspartate--tRNA ligase [Phycisphaerales bacterium]
MLKRSHMCGELRAEHIGQSVTLNGWVNTFRDQGKGLVFIDLRDREGMTQVVFDLEDADEKVVEEAKGLRREDVVAVRGVVQKRVAGPNPKLATGEIEVMVSELEVLNKTEKPPILPDEHEAEKIAEEVRLRHRYIDLRRPRMQGILRTRHEVNRIARDYFSSHGFLEVETPCLIKTTPEGARDFIVPSRIYPGKWYALPQSPQIFKQILMVAGCDRYMQIVRCFRDEDPRADRQAEFSQIDLELSFVDRDDVMKIISGFAQRVWKEIRGVDIGEIPVMSYKEAMERYGIDRPDLRFGLEITDISDLAAKTEFRVFSEALGKETGVVKAMLVPGGAEKMSRKVTDGYNEFVKTFKAGGAPTVKYTDNGYETGIAKFVGPIEDELKQRLGLEKGDIVFFTADTWDIATKSMGELRNRVARDLDLIDQSLWKFVWVVDFPMFEYDEEAKRWVALHHPFTAPMPEEVERLESDPGGCVSAAYDLVCNGSEIAGGSIRMHRPEIQQKVFKLLGIGEAEAELKFGFLLKALRYGAPPHGGIAFGLDRLIMLLAGTENIREVIAFPKTLNGVDLMTEAPGPVDAAQLEELHVQVTASEGALVEDA